MTLCAAFPKRYQELSTKPKQHRLLELYTHTLPAFGHVRHFGELVFECAHQPLKRALKRSNHKLAHLQAMKHVPSDEWKARIRELIGQCSYDGSTEEDWVTGALRRLIFGQGKGNSEQDIGSVEQLTNYIPGGLMESILNVVLPKSSRKGLSSTGLVE